MNSIGFDCMIELCDFHHRPVAMILWWKVQLVWHLEKCFWAVVLCSTPYYSMRTVNGIYYVCYSLYDFVRQLLRESSNSHRQSAYCVVVVVLCFSFDGEHHLAISIILLRSTSINLHDHSKLIASTTHRGREGTFSMLEGKYVNDNNAMIHVDMHVGSISWFRPITSSWLRP